MTTLNDAEARITSFLLDIIPGSEPRGVINCEASDASAGYTGSIYIGSGDSDHLDIVDVLRASQPRSESFGDLLINSRNASRSHALGPWYRLNIRIDGRHAVHYDYFWENAPITSLKDIERSIHGDLPSFVLARQFDRELVNAISDFEITNALLTYVPARTAVGKPVSDALLDVFATVDWQTDVNNGTMNQYFAREHDPMLGLPRTDLYVRTYRGLHKIGCASGVALFAESIGLYAHFHERVDKARRVLAINAVPRQQKSDIMDRYYRIEQDVETARNAYVRAHIERLTQDT